MLILPMESSSWDQRIAVLRRQKEAAVSFDASLKTVKQRQSIKATPCEAQVKRNLTKKGPKENLQVEATLEQMGT